MGGGGGGTTTNTVQKSDPWSGQQPYLTYGFQQAQNLYKSDQPSYYLGSTVAPQSATTQGAINLQTQRALSGNPLQASTNNQLQNTINGSYLGANPYLDANFAAGADKIKSNYLGSVGQVNSGLAGAGRYGSGVGAYQQDMANDTLASNLGNLYSQTYYDNYKTERGNQMGAMGMAPTMINQDYVDLDKLSDAGAAQEAYAQAIKDADINRWNYKQNLQAEKLGQFLQMIQGNYGSSVTTQTPLSGQSTLGTILGGGALAGGLYNALS